MRGRDATKELTLKVNISKVFTYGFSETMSIVNHNSQSDGQSKSAKRCTDCPKQNHTCHLSTEEFKRYQGQWYLTLKKSGKMSLCDFDQIFELQSLSKTVFIVSQVRKLQNQFPQRNTGDGPLPQANHGGDTSKRLVELMINFLKRSFCFSWFRLQLMTIHCNRRCV